MHWTHHSRIDRVWAHTAHTYHANKSLVLFEEIRKSVHVRRTSTIRNASFEIAMSYTGLHCQSFSLAHTQADTCQISSLSVICDQDLRLSWWIFVAVRYAMHLHLFCSNYSADCCWCWFFSSSFVLSINYKLRSSHKIKQSYNC